MRGMDTVVSPSSVGRARVTDDRRTYLVVGWLEPTHSQIGIIYGSLAY